MRLPSIGKVAAKYVVVKLRLLCHVDLAYAVTICDVPVLVQTATARATYLGGVQHLHVALWFRPVKAAPL
jgi:hypothetical protein